MGRGRRGAAILPAVMKSFCHSTLFRRVFSPRLYQVRLSQQVMLKLPPGEEPSLVRSAHIPHHGGSLPLIVLSLEAGRTREQRRQLADAVYEALRSAIGIPENDRFVSIREHGAGDLIADPEYLGVARSEHPIFVEITLRRGRPVEKKQALYREIAGRMAATGLVRPEDVLIVLRENETPDWSFGNGVAQYVEAEAEQSKR